MQAVLRPVRDPFLKEVVFPALKLASELPRAAEFLLERVRDDDTRLQLELMIDPNHEDQAGRWNDAMYRLLFFDWTQTAVGWTLSQPFIGYAGGWEDTFNLTLLLEDDEYPYDDERSAAAYRRSFWSKPQPLGLTSLLCGVWDPVPAFRPDVVLTSTGNGAYDTQAKIARADWAWRSMVTVNVWAARLPTLLTALLDRELRRLHPVEAPERQEVLQYWLGLSASPPLLAVSFSGLGPRAANWIRDIGMLSKLVRDAAVSHQGLTSIINRRQRTDG